MTAGASRRLWLPLQPLPAAAARAGGAPQRPGGGPAAAQLLLSGLRDGLLPAAAASGARARGRAASHLEPLRLRGHLPGARALPARPAAGVVALARARVVAADAASAARRARRLLARARARRLAAPARSWPARSTRSRASRCRRLNLYLFLQALALAPFVAGLLRRAARDGARGTSSGPRQRWHSGYRPTPSSSSGRRSCWAWRLGGCEGPVRGALGRMRRRSRSALASRACRSRSCSGCSGKRRAGRAFGGDVALANAVHPVVLLQTAGAAPPRFSERAGRGVLGRALLQQGPAVLPDALPGSR